MPASKKMLASRQKAENRANGIGDEEGRLPARVKAAEVKAKCSLCGLEIRVTKTNTEIKQHHESKHPSSLFAEVFPTVSLDAPVASAASGSSSTGTSAPAPEKKKAPKSDLSFLDDALKPASGKKK